ncbi:MAG: cysteine--tRNA ligase [Myxococcota bacterium]|jgi:cysteinyl-tRNA synthetase|nr:cysteine--tRNA ligase [Myxococcota bacterium]
MSLSIYDTAQRSKRPFEPISPGEFNIYVCGLTVYDLPHIGHARTFVCFDVVCRFLRQRGWKVTLVRNHTDIDDKIIRRAKEEQQSPFDLASKMIEELGKDMAALGVQPADVEPRVTEHIPEILDMTQRLLEKGHAYQVEQDVYYRVRSFARYGSLSNRKLDDMQSGARVEVDERKEDPMDFALWKGVHEPTEPSWTSPWGQGRPGWHIECSAMSHKYLGVSFDVHGGGRDLIFPHHENECAQSIAANGGDFARYWMHVGMVEIDGEKMSHSLKNFWTIRDLLEQVHPEALRFFFLTTHYRNNINFSRDTIQAATDRITSLYRLLESLDAMATAPDNARAEKVDEIERCEVDFIEAMEDDFNTPRALAALSTLEHLAQDIATRRGKLSPERRAGAKRAAATLRELGKHVGLLERDVNEALLQLQALAVKRLGLDTREVEALMAQRAAAREAKDWARADELRASIEGMGVQVLDRPGGSVWQVN